MARNGGIWKSVKRHLGAVTDPARVMVQCLHFTSYNLSRGAWDDWFSPYYDSTRLARELARTFGAKRDVFVDSGGFQMLNGDKLDLSKWGLKVSRDDVLELQLKYHPQRLASLDYPIGLKVPGDHAAKLARDSIANAKWLAEQSDSLPDGVKPYVVVHGRDPSEVKAYLDKLGKALPRGWMRRHDVGVALGSQVPLKGQPEIVIANAATVLDWMAKHAAPDVPFHAFGAGEAVVGQLMKRTASKRSVSFDNSTWVQKSYRLSMHDPSTHKWVRYDPHEMPECGCGACKRLEHLGEEFVHGLMTKPAYHSSLRDGEKVIRSDILALIALHNLSWWKARLDGPLRRKGEAAPFAPMKAATTHYEFPFKDYEARADHLLIMTCSKQRPYGASRSHRRVLAALEAKGLREGKDFDRITLSGLYGPVHWKHEAHPAIMAYDFQLGRLVSAEHKLQLEYRTSSVLNVIRKKYDGNSVAVLDSKPYREVFEPVVTRFDGRVVDSPTQVAESFS
ncbi:MAG TPA: hypothetical protein VM327_03200 [Candidatus Thermoplasmatota archaeon]|nr:hypothetical protein [Candidatus Thermoplasmatota archaeon]